MYQVFCKSVGRRSWVPYSDPFYREAQAFECLQRATASAQTDVNGHYIFFCIKEIKGASA